MAYVGDWGTFIHIPKCGGQDTRARLDAHFCRGYKHPDYPDRKDIKREEIGAYHAVPSEILELPPPYFAIVRHPVTYMRSIWSYFHRNRWFPNHNDPVPNWPAIFGLVRPYINDDWEGFVSDITERNPGVVSAIFRMYYHPFIRYYKLENLEEMYEDLGMIEIVRKQPRQNYAPTLPEISGRIAERIVNTEAWALETFGYGNEWR